MTLAKDILDKYSDNETIVIPKNSETIGYNPKLKRPYYVKATWRREAHKYKYTTLGFSFDLCLWTPPINSLTIEFDGLFSQNGLWVLATEQKCKEFGIDYCLCEHGGTSPYLWIFNIDGCNDLRQRVALAKLLVPSDAKLDYSNISGKTLVPCINLRHWKHSLIHRIVRGKNPLKHKNKLPEQCKLDFKNAEEILHDADAKPQHSIQTFFSCDGLNNTKIKKILETDFKVQHLMSGDLLTYKSPSEARLALLNCLVAYGLDDQQIHTLMSRSHGLNYQEKTHLRERELGMARRFVTKPRLDLNKYLEVRTNGR